VRAEAPADEGLISVDEDLRADVVGDPLRDLDPATVFGAILLIGAATAAGLILGEAILVPITEVGSMASAFGWLLAYFHIPQLFVDQMARMGGSVTTVGFITAFCFLVIGCFIDAIPAIIIVGTILSPLAASVGMHPIHFAIIGVISIAYGLVTPPYGLCLMIACSIGGIKIKQAVRDTLILFVPMIAVLVFVIFLPDAMLWLPRTLMPNLVK